MKEPSEARDVDAWQLIDNNICCLTSDHTFTFDGAERENLEMIADLAKEVGAYSKS